MALAQLDFVVKVGGGAITNKKVLETPRIEVIHKVAEVLADCYASGKRFIVLHGAGSFGHHQCKEYEVNEGYNSNTSSEIAHRRKIGFSLGRASVNQLSLILIKELIKSGIPALLVSTFATWETDNGEVIKADCSKIKQALAENYVPVLSGDVVFDVAKGCNVLSSDVLLQVLCERLDVRRAIFLMDCRGIYTQPPEKPGAELLHKILIEENGNVSIPLEMNCTVPDVSGGICSKLKQGARVIVAHHGRIPVFYCSLDSDAFHQICTFTETENLEATRLSLMTNVQQS